MFHSYFRRLRLLSGLVFASSLCLLPSVAQHGFASSGTEARRSALKPLYRDPVHDGAADPSLIWDRLGNRWLMFYTNRRADLATTDPKDVVWVHGTRIGIAESKDGGTTWHYVGTANLPYGERDYTFWAPVLVWDKGLYHMFLTVVPGTLHNWDAPRQIIHLTSSDLVNWRFVSKLSLSSDRTIDPCIFRLSKRHWRLWYKDERDHSYIHYADSPDLNQWTPVGTAIFDRPSEGPVVFHFKGSLWLIVDAWDGLAVYRSTDATHWIPQPNNLLAGPGLLPSDRSEGHHADVIVSNHRAFLFYFVQQRGSDEATGVANAEHRSVLQVVEMKEEDGKLKADRDRPTFVLLAPDDLTQGHEMERAR